MLPLWLKFKLSQMAGSQGLLLPGAWLFLFPCRHLEPRCAGGPQSSSQHTRKAELHDRWTLTTETNH